MLFHVKHTGQFGGLSRECDLIRIVLPVRNRMRRMNGHASQSRCCEALTIAIIFPRP